jgi:hypothetical protein
MSEQLNAPYLKSLSEPVCSYFYIQAIVSKVLCESRGSDCLIVFL